MPGQPRSEVLVPKIKQLNDEGKLAIEPFLIVPGWIDADPVGSNVSRSAILNRPEFSVERRFRCIEEPRLSNFGVLFCFTARHAQNTRLWHLPSGRNLQIVLAQNLNGTPDRRQLKPRH
jgi:hypothetical protein